MEEKIGHVTHFFNKLGVAAIEIERGELHKGDRIHIVGHTTDIEQVVDSIELDHHPIEDAKEGMDIGVKVEDHVRDHDVVYKTYM